MPRISVIIPALNEEKYIEHPFRGLKKQSFRDFEVIVADGGSKDRTREIARKYAKVVIERAPGMAAGRNTGAKLAKGDILVFLDADTEPDKDYLLAYANGFADGVATATGPIYPLEKTDPATELGYWIVSVLWVRIAILLGEPVVVGSNFAVDRKIFNKVGGFNPKLMTYEDFDLSRRIKKYGKTVFLEKAAVKTSARRVVAWGIGKYFVWHVGNILRYYLLKKPKEDYGHVR